MAIDFTAIARQTDAILNELGLYETITYVDNQDQAASSKYNPITGEYEGASTITYTFQAVIVTEQNVLQGDGSSYGLGQQLIAIPSQITFDLSAGQILSFDNSDWIVDSFNRAPQNTVITISVRRK